MKEESYSYHQEQYSINESRTTNVNRVIIIPYGYPKNHLLLEAKRGDTLLFNDNRMSVVEETFLLPTTSRAFEGMCRMVYGLPAKDIILQWRDKYQFDIQYDTALVIVYNSRFSNDRT